MLVGLRALRPFTSIWLLSNRLEDTHFIAAAVSAHDLFTERIVAGDLVFSRHGLIGKPFG